MNRWHLVCMTFLLIYLKSDWLKVGLALTNRPNALNVLCFDMTISGCWGLKVCGRCGLWLLMDHLAELVEPSTWAPDRPRTGARLSAVRMTGTFDRLDGRTCPCASVLLFLLLFRAFWVTTPCNIFDVRGLSSTISFVQITDFDVFFGFMVSQKMMSNANVFGFVVLH
jgi:hypothetical protein